MNRAPRSFVLRQGRITSAQVRALEELWPRYGLPPLEHFDPQQAFAREAPLLVEIGFGDGEALIESAGACPDWNCLGFEVHGPGVGHCLQRIEALALTNVRLIRHDVVEVLSGSIGESMINECRIFFPDPWPKARHQKRRLIAPAFLDLLAPLMASGGTLRMATDDDGYAAEMMAHLSEHAAFHNAHDDGAFAPRFPRPYTRFERRAQRLGHTVHDLHFVRTGGPG